MLDLAWRKPDVCVWAKFGIDVREKEEENHSWGLNGFYLQN
jgi:hypothetical protein